MKKGMRLVFILALTMVMIIGTAVMANAETNNDPTYPYQFQLEKDESNSILFETNLDISKGIKASDVLNYRISAPDGKQFTSYGELIVGKASCYLVEGEFDKKSVVEGSIDLSKNQPGIGWSQFAVTLSNSSGLYEIDFANDPTYAKWGVQITAGALDAKQVTWKGYPTKVEFDTSTVDTTASGKYILAHFTDIDKKQVLDVTDKKKQTVSGLKGGKSYKVMLYGVNEKKDASSYDLASLTGSEITVKTGPATKPSITAKITKKKDKKYYVLFTNKYRYDTQMTFSFTAKKKPAKISGYEVKVEVGGSAYTGTYKKNVKSFKYNFGRDTANKILGKKFTVSVRTYTNTDGTKVYSNWSNKVTLKS